jgi:hypothetical protein
LPALISLALQFFVVSPFLQLQLLPLLLLQLLLFLFQVQANEVFFSPQVQPCVSIQARISLWLQLLPLLLFSQVQTPFIFFQLLVFHIALWPGQELLLWLCAVPLA